MNDDHIAIDYHRNPNPQKRRTFTVQCFSYGIVTTVTSTPCVVRNWLYRIWQLHRHRLHKLVVGLGVQQRPSVNSDATNPPATLQLCIGCHCLIFQLGHAPSIPLALRRFLSDPNVTYVGVWNQNEVEALLLNSKHRLSLSKFVDLREVAAERRGLSDRLSMEKLAEILLQYEGVKMRKRIRRSNWEVQWLSEEQVQYACVDAFLSFSIGKALRVWDCED